jgi:hypothetical protein
MRRRWSRPQPGDHDHAVDRLPCETARTAVGGEYHAGGQGTSLKSKAVMARSNHDLALPPSESLPQIGPPKSHHRCPCIDPARNIFGIGSFIREFFCAPLARLAPVRAPHRHDVGAGCQRSDLVVAPGAPRGLGDRVPPQKLIPGSAERTCSPGWRCRSYAPIPSRSLMQTGDKSCIFSHNLLSPSVESLDFRALLCARPGRRAADPAAGDRTA